MIFFFLSLKKSKLLLSENAAFSLFLSRKVILRVIIAEILFTIMLQKV
jgi:hypothetical protein